MKKSEITFRPYKTYLENQEYQSNLSNLTMHLQLNVIDRRTILDAQQNPQRYAGLMARVADYSAYFADLSQEAQDEVISRSEHCTM